MSTHSGQQHWQDSMDAHFGASDIGWNALIPAIITTTLSTIAVSLRLYTRCRIVRHVGADDWVILGSLILAWAMCVIIGIQASERIGVTIPSVNEGMIVKLTIINNNIWILLVNLTKASILAQYLRLFSTSRLRYACYVLVFILVPTAVYGVLLGTLLCTPVAKLWTPQLEGHCMDAEAYWISVACIDIILDVVILALPICAVSRLSLQPRQRFAILLAFSLGFAVCSISIARLITVIVTAQMGHYTASGVWAIIWSVIEANIGIVCASILSLKALVLKIWPDLVDEPKGVHVLRNSCVCSELGWGWEEERNYQISVAKSTAHDGLSLNSMTEKSSHMHHRGDSIVSNMEP